MKKLIPADTVDPAGNVLETTGKNMKESIPADTVDPAGNMKKLIPAASVDAAGNVWETTGENIRHGVKDFSNRDVKMIVSMMFPVGTVYCGENSFILSVGKWKQITASELSLLYLGTNSPTGEQYNYFPHYTSTGSDASSISVRIWKRVS